jgi:small subunit ribosomal protein S19
MAKENTTNDEMSLKKKELTYRGKSIDELKKLDIREFAKLLKSNERRTVLRQYGELEKFISRSHTKVVKNKLIKTHARHLIVVPNMVGLKLNIHNGNTFVPIDLTIDMLGHRLGEFSVTRTKVKHGAAGIGATKSSASASVK